MQSHLDPPVGVLLVGVHLVGVAVVVGVGVEVDRMREHRRHHRRHRVDIALTKTVILVFNKVAT